MTHARLITPDGVREGAIHLARGRIAAIRSRAPRAARRIDVRGASVAPGFIDVHVWGDPEALARRLPAEGTTAFVSTIGPEPSVRLLERVAQAPRLPDSGARWLGWHLEGPWVNPQRAGALPQRWMRAPALGELARVVARARGAVKLVTLAPERRGTASAVRWLHRRGIVVSLGHSIASEQTAQRAIAAGARAVTHVFNGMPLFHHRVPGLLGAALTDDRLTTMVIADGVHVSPSAFRLLARAKGPERIVLVTDSIAAAPSGARRRGGAFYNRSGVLAGSCLTMVQAVRNAMRWGLVDLPTAARMASTNPANLLGVGRRLGTLEVGKRADLVVLDRQAHVHMTLIDGRVAYKRGMGSD